MWTVRLKYVRIKNKIRLWEAGPFFKNYIMLKALRQRSQKFWPKILTPYFSFYVPGKWLHSCRSNRLLMVFQARKVKLHHKLQILGLNLSKNRNNKAELVVPITFNITLLQSISHFTSSLSPWLLRKNEFTFLWLSQI